MSHYNNNHASTSSASSSKPPVPDHFKAPLPVSNTAAKDYNPTYVAPSPMIMTGQPGTFGAGWDGNGPGSFGSQQHPSHDDGHHAGPSYETARQIATLQSRLDRKLGPEYVSQRAGPGGECSRQRQNGLGGGARMLSFELTIGWASARRRGTLVRIPGDHPAAG